MPYSRTGQILDPTGEILDGSKHTMFAITIIVLLLVAGRSFDVIPWFLQELNEKRVTLMEGTALSERDLQRSRAESASAVFLLADRFSPSYQQEDLNVQFQVSATHQQACLAAVCSPLQGPYFLTMGASCDCPSF